MKYYTGIVKHDPPNSYGDCLELMKNIPDSSVDMILCDLPYGTTACSWDSVIPFELLWKEYWRIVKPNAAIVLFGAEPFSSALRMSSIKNFKYDWIWCKSRALGFTNAKNKPLNKHEVVSVFSKGTNANRALNNTPYFPQNLKYSGKTVKGKKGSTADLKQGSPKFGRPGQLETYIQEFTNYPTSLLEFSNDTKTLHPTQKPVALFEYLIKTYTHEGMTVLDNCAGSGTTAIACENTNRKWICIEKDLSYYLAAIARVWKHDNNSPQ